MAESLPSPPMSRDSTPAPSTLSTDEEHLTRRLDELLEKYLEALDEYSILREQMSKLFSDGFMSLAHAQRTSNLGPGRRYGEDGYDCRMKALKRVKIAHVEPIDQPETDQLLTRTPKLGPANSSRNTLQVDIAMQTPTNIYKLTEKPAESDSIVAPETNREQSIPQNAGAMSKVSMPEKIGGGQQPTKQDPAYRDPVTWYGILVPPPLRQAQKSFSTSVDSCIPKLVEAKDRLESLESHIWITRQKLGIDSDY